MPELRQDKSLNFTGVLSYQSIPFFEDHRDPFDRFLLATALSEQIPIISIDEKFSRYRPLITVIN